MQVRLSVAIAAAVVLSGCASYPLPVQSNITEFHRLAPPTTQDTYAVLPWRKDLEGSLEFQTYATQLADGMRAKGFNVVPDGSPAKFAVFLDYGIDTGRTEVSSYSIPQWGVTGYSGATTTGTVSTFGSTSYLNARTTATPTYGVTGYTQGTTSQRVYRRFVNVDIVEVAADATAPKKVYEGKLRSEGICGALPVVMPVLLTALLTKFPGESGKPRTESIPLPGTGC